jgi:RHS repeat-associated protein
VVNSTCGPRPDLALADPSTVGTETRFVKTDHVPAVGSYTVLVESESGERRFLEKTLPLPDGFGIEESDLFPGVANHVYIEAQASCGRTGYSNGVTYSLAEGGNMQGGMEENSSVWIEGGDDGGGGGGGSQIPPPAMNAQFVHWDHLGSTRLMTDEKGAEIGHWKYYPFGQEAESSGGTDNRMKFTGHERDGELGLDYMLARFYAPSTARFVSVDPESSSASPLSPQSWNRYAYALNSPLDLVDRNGQYPQVALNQSVARAPDPLMIYQAGMAVATFFGAGQFSESCREAVHKAAESARTDFQSFVSCMAAESEAKAPPMVLAYSPAIVLGSGANCGGPPSIFSVNDSSGRFSEVWLRSGSTDGPCNMVETVIEERGHGCGVPNEANDPNKESDARGSATMMGYACAAEVH